MPKVTKNNKTKVNNIEKKKVNINNSDDSDSEYDNDIKQTKNNFNVFDSSSDSSSDSELELNSSANIKVKENINNVNNTINTINTENTKIPEIKTKTNKKQIKKDKYTFELNNNKKLQKNTNNITTLYSDKIEITINGKILINESDIVINAETKYMVLGQNGIGKTTLLKYIYEKINNTTDILMINQDIEIESTTQTISEFILDADILLNNSKKRMNLLEQKEELTDEETEEYNNLAEIIYQKEWDKYEAESKRIINGLGFMEPNMPVNILSGGKRMILAIGKALLRKPDILILDEPTNHLDLDVVIWLTNYLETYKKTLIIITHQIGLVNIISDVIWYIGNPELTGNKVYTIRGKYDKLIKFLDITQKETNNKYDKFTKRIEELKKKSTPKKDVEEFIKKNGVPRPPKPYTVNITFDNIIELSTKNIIEFRNVTFSYDDNLIYNNLNISLNMGSRMILVGHNGCGKTTFFKLASKQIMPSGTNSIILSDERLRVGYYNQQIIDTLPMECSSIEYLQNLNPKLDNNQCRTILGKLGIKKIDNLDLPTNKIKDLSGGQKARVSFASVQMLNPHLILLDEPTNHLDLESIEGLIKGINDFNGGIVIITHDMYLIEMINNADIYQVINNNIIKFNGDFNDYCITKINSYN